MTTFGFASTAEEVTADVNLDGKTVLITGVNSGLGKESARVLGMRGATIVGLARSVDKAQSALDEVGAKGTAVACDLSEPASVRAAVQTVVDSGVTLDVILGNAGIMALPKLEQKHGLELQFLTNHMGHFLLVTGLLDQLADDGRVVIVSSGAHFWADEEVGIDLDDLSGDKTYSAWRQYGMSKLANILFTRQLAKRFEGTSKVANALHPGVIKTNLSRHLEDQSIFDDMDPAKIKTIPQGAATQCLLAVHPEGAAHSGAYFSDCQPAEGSKWCTDDALAEALWAKSEELASTL